MKLSVAVFSLALAYVRGSSLRAAGDNYSASKHKILGTEVVLNGAIGEPTTEDMEFIGKALVASYNDVHWEAGHYMTGAQTTVDFKGTNPNTNTDTDNDIQRSGSSSSIFEVQTPVLIWIWPGFLCRHCPDDDAMGASSTQQSLLLTAISEDCAGLCKKEATAELEANFCDRIRSAPGSRYLGSAKSCGMTFDADGNNDNDSNDNNNDNDNNGNEATKPSSNNSDVNTSNAPNTVATIDSTIILKGVGAGVTTQEEKAILAKAFVSAYNDVHWDDNHYLSDAEMPFVAATENNFMTGDSDAIAIATNTLVVEVQTPVLIWIWPGFLCRHCPDDDVMGSQLRFDSNGLEALNSNTFDKKAVEVAFCNKIQNSVSDKLAATESCSIAIESVVASESETKAW